MQTSAAYYEGNTNAFEPPQEKDTAPPVDVSVDVQDETVLGEKKKEEKNDMRCTFLPLCAFVLLGAIWGSAFLFIRYGVHPDTGFKPVCSSSFRETEN